MNHKEKVKLAKRMSGGFLGRDWDKHREGIAIGVVNRNARIKKAVEAKKKAKEEAKK